MGNFRNNRGTSGFGSEGRSRGTSRFGGGSRGGFGGGGRSGVFRGRDSGEFGGRDREMHEVACDKCGKQCKVPFRPSGRKPIYCSDCFRSNGESDSRGSLGARREEKSAPSGGGISSEQFKQLNTKLDKILNVLEQLEIDVEEEDDENKDSEGEDK